MNANANVVHLRSAKAHDAYGFIYGGENCLMQLTLVQRRGVMAALRAELQPGDAAPHDSFCPVPGPGHPLVGRTAFTADQQFRQGELPGVLPQFRPPPLLQHLPLAGPACHLSLYPVERLPGDDGGVVVLYVIHRALPLVLLHLFGKFL